MSLFRPSTARSRAARPVAQVLVREVHLTMLQVFAYVGVFAALSLAAVEVASSPHLERAVAKLVSAPALATRSDWIEAAQAPKLRGRD